MPKGRFARFLGLALALLTIVGIAYERVGRVRDRERYPQIGRSFDIGGRSLNMHCVGEGSPVVVFDTSSHQAGYSWIAVQSQVAQFTRACWYDRAGYGWSDPGPRRRTFTDVATDLHRLLQVAGDRPPYVFVGMGEAGLHLRVYNGLYPSDVAAAVIVNSPDVDPSDIQEPEFLQGPWARHFGERATLVRRAACAFVLPILMESGLGRLKWQLQGPRRTPAYGLAPDQQRQLDFLSDNPVASASGELCAREESVEQVRSAGGFGNRPLVVITSERRIGLQTQEAQLRKAVDDYNEYWIKTVQPRLARLSTNGRLVVVENEPVLGCVVEQIKLLIS